MPATLKLAIPMEVKRHHHEAARVPVITDLPLVLRVLRYACWDDVVATVLPHVKSRQYGFDAIPNKCKQFD